MNLRQVARPLAGFTLLFSLSPLVPLVAAKLDGADSRVSWAFVITTLAGVAFAFVLWLGGRKPDHDLFRREALAVVSLSWLVAGMLSAIPFQMSGAIPSNVDAFFESVSGLTTTGATVLGTANTDIESLPRSILLWRSMIQWMGGIGIVLAFIVLLPAMGVTGSKLLKAEEIGIPSGQNRPRMQQQARQLFLLYSILTVAAGLCYWIVGMDPHDAVCHAFTTLATGGFSTKNASVGEFHSAGIEVVAIVFMFLAGCNFLFLISIATTKPRGGRTIDLIRRVEFRVYLALTLIIIVALTVILWSWGRPVPDDVLGLTHDYSSLGRCIRDAAFQATSILTSTGYASADFQRWPKPALYLLMVAMFVGGSTGSTAGGFKILRIVICAKLTRHTLRHFIHPRSIEHVRVGPDVIPHGVVSTILAMLLLWALTVAAGTFVLDLDPRLDLVSAFTASLSMMSCVGPSISEVVPAGDGTFHMVGLVDLGPYSGYGELHWGAKLFMSLQMILGRLEILAPLVLLVPSFWRRV